MARNALFFVAVLAAMPVVLTSTSSVAGQTSAQLDVALRPQEGDMWCWAASTEMIAEYVLAELQRPASVEQCSLVAKVWGYVPGQVCGAMEPCTASQGAVCSSSTYSRASCDSLPLSLCGLGSAYTKTGKSLAWKQIVKQIDDGKPLGVKIYSSGFHFIVVRGYRQTSSQEKWLLTLDPWPTCEGDGWFERSFEMGFEEYKAKEWVTYSDIGP